MTNQKHSQTILFTERPLSPEDRLGEDYDGEIVVNSRGSYILFCPNCKTNTIGGSDIGKPLEIRCSNFHCFYESSLGSEFLVNGQPMIVRMYSAERENAKKILKRMEKSE